jgi:hypothetical protein
MSTAKLSPNAESTPITGRVKSVAWLLLLPLRVAVWPIVHGVRALDRNFVSYMTSRVLRDEERVYSVKFVWYGDAVYLHPMIWGSLILYGLSRAGLVAPGWLLLAWFVGLAVCFMTIMYNFDIIKFAVLGTALAALFGAAYFARMELAWNPLSEVARHVAGLHAQVSAGFYIASAYVFTLLIMCEVVWAWLFHRVEVDESYVYEHQFLQGVAREPIFAQGMRRETKDLLEMLILGAADIQHRTKKGFKRFKNVPLASLGLGRAIDTLLDHKRKGEIRLRRKDEDDADQVRIQDAMQESVEDWDEATDGEGEGVASESSADADSEDDGEMF